MSAFNSLHYSGLGYGSLCIIFASVAVQRVHEVDSSRECMKSFANTQEDVAVASPHADNFLYVYLC